MAKYFPLFFLSQFGYDFQSLVAISFNCHGHCDKASDRNASKGYSVSLLWEKYTLCQYAYPWEEQYGVKYWFRWEEAVIGCAT